MLSRNAGLDVHSAAQREHPQVLDGLVREDGTEKAITLPLSALPGLADLLDQAGHLSVRYRARWVKVAGAGTRLYRARLILAG